MLEPLVLDEPNGTFVRWALSHMRRLARTQRVEAGLQQWRVRAQLSNARNPLDRAQHLIQHGGRCTHVVLFWNRIPSWATKEVKGYAHGQGYAGGRDPLVMFHVVGLPRRASQ